MTDKLNWKENNNTKTYINYIKEKDENIVDQINKATKS